MSGRAPVAAWILISALVLGACGCTASNPTWSRYQIYRYEIANNLINDWSGNGLADNVNNPPGNGENGAPYCAAANGVSNKVTHLVYSHHHADHAGASSLFDKSVARIGLEETRKLLLRDDDPARPAPEETFQDRRTLEIDRKSTRLNSSH